MFLENTLMNLLYIQAGIKRYIPPVEPLNVKEQVMCVRKLNIELRIAAAKIVKRYVEGGIYLLDAMLSMYGM